MDGGREDWTCRVRELNVKSMWHRRCHHICDNAIIFCVNMREMDVLNEGISYVSAFEE